MTAGDPGGQQDLERRQESHRLLVQQRKKAFGCRGVGGRGDTSVERSFVTLNDSMVILKNVKEQDCSKAWSCCQLQSDLYVCRVYTVLSCM